MAWAIATTNEGSRTSRSNWLLRPAGDFFCIFFIPLASVGYFFLSPESQQALFPIALTATIFLFLGGHTLAPTLYYLSSPKERKRIHLMQPKLPYYLLGCMLFPLCLMLGSAYFFSVRDFESQRKLFSAYALVYVFWNSYHFMMQQRGLLALYKKRAGRASGAELFFDHTLCVISLFFIPLLIIGTKEDGFSWFGTLFGTPLLIEASPTLLLSSKIMIGILTLTAALYSIKKLTRSLPLSLMYSIIFIQAFGIVQAPKFFLFVVYGATHWLQEIYLISNYCDRPQKHAKAVAFVGLFLASIGSYVFLSTVHRNHHVEVNGTYRGMEDLSMGTYLILSIFISLRLGFALTHFCLDRYIHRGREFPSYA